MTRDIDKQRATLYEKEHVKGMIQTQIEGKKSELSPKQAQKLARQNQLQLIQDQ